MPTCAWHMRQSTSSIAHSIPRLRAIAWHRAPFIRPRYLFLCNPQMCISCCSVFGGATSPPHIALSAFNNLHFSMTFRPHGLARNGLPVSEMMTSCALQNGSIPPLGSPSYSVESAPSDPAGKAIPVRNSSPGVPRCVIAPFATCHTVFLSTNRRRFPIAGRLGVLLRQPMRIFSRSGSPVSSTASFSIPCRSGGRFFTWLYFKQRRRCVGIDSHPRRRCIHGQR